MNVLITGASSGIGKDMAFYMLSLGYSLYVVSSKKEELDRIYTKYSDRVITIGLDLSVINNCYKLYDMLRDKDIGILINNASFGDSGNFSETSLDKEIDMINVNICAYHVLTKLFLRDMVSLDRGRILNVCSMAGVMPGPYMACYYATKSYIYNLTLAIARELKNDKSHVKVSLFCPGPVETNFEARACVKFKIKMIDSDYASRYAIDNMFLNKLVIVPPNMKLLYYLVKISPISLVLFLNSNIQRRI